MEFIINDYNYEYYIEKNIKYISFECYFNKNIDNIIFPESLLYLIFGDYFNQNIDKVKFPNSLLRITFGYSFYQKINNIKFPNSLKLISFKGSYPFTINKNIFPKSLESLCFTVYTNQIQCILNVKNIFIKYLFKPIICMHYNIKNIIILYSKINFDTERCQYTLKNIKKSKLPYGCKVIYK